MSNPHNHRSVPGRSRCSRSLLVSVSNLRTTQRLLLLVLLFQLNTLLLALSLLPAPLPSLLGASARHDRQLKQSPW